MANLNENNLIKIPKSKPYWIYPTIKIDDNLRNQINKQTDEKTNITKITKEYLMNRYHGNNKIYTDGSKTEERVGCGLYHEGTDTSQSWRITDNTAVLTAELVAIIQAMQHALKNKLQN